MSNTPLKDTESMGDLMSAVTKVMQQNQDIRRQDLEARYAKYAEPVVQEPETPEIEAQAEPETVETEVEELTGE